MDRIEDRMTVEKLFSKKEKKYDIIEMLYCDGGCNNGNGL